METAIVSLIMIAMIVFGGMTMSKGFITSVDTTAMALDTVGQRDEKILRTELTPEDANLVSNSVLNVYLGNTGQTKLADFSKWDVIVQYYGTDNSTYHVAWLPYTAGVLGNNQWHVYEIEMNGQPEVFNRNILDPGETITVQLQLNPSVGRNSTNMVTVSTPNGVPASIAFYRN